MLEHLDDPSPPEPTAQALGTVLERSYRLRRRRSLSAATGAGVMALALGVLIGSVLVRSSAPVSTDFATRAGVATGTAVPLSDLEDVTFVSDSVGFGLAGHGAQTALAETENGGDTWQVVQGDLPAKYPTQILFANSTRGYLWGGAPSTDGALPLWLTSDGGRRWVEAPIGPVVSDVSAIGSDVWAMVGTCFIGASEPAGSCPVILEVSVDGGATWAASGSSPPLTESSALSISDQDVELARMTNEHAYVLSFVPNATGTGSSSGQLVFTSDGGQTWSPRSDPCPSRFDFGEQIAGSGTQDLWLMCASQASGGTQAKALYRSTDGGHNWTLAAAANAPVLSGNVVLPAGGGLPAGGYVSPYSLGHEDFAVLSPTTAWLFPDRAGVFETSSGGLRWKPVDALANAGFAWGGAGNVVFVNATHGWVCETGTGLWRTSDGESWQRLGQ
jgi:hypothetical protein